MYQDANGKKWWKGNLHTHTTRSDGRRTPEEAVGLYRDSGYDFLALTDHWVCSESCVRDGLLLLAGCEYDVGTETAEKGIYHILSIGAKEPPALRKEAGLGPQEVLDAVHEAGGFAILAHPSWSLNRPEKILELRGVDASEIYNTMSGVPWNGRRADSSVILDEVSAGGMLLPCIATDDAHFYNGEHCRSFVWVQAEELTQDAILEALRAGRFYASQGPRMEVRLEGGRVRVKCSPARHVVFYSNQVWSTYRTVSGENLTEAEYLLGPQETFVRVEVIDGEGNLAWSSPVFTGRMGE